MGVTIESKNHAIDMGYAGFNTLRTKVAELAGEDIGEHYKELHDGIFLFGNLQKKFFKDYDKKTEEISKKYNGKKDAILQFLYAPDTDATMTSDVCKQIYEVIKDYDDNFAYGYAGRADCAKFKDFKEIVKDCIDNDCNMEWF